MYTHDLDLLAIMIERERQTRLALRQLEAYPQPREPLRSRLGRLLVRIGLQLDPAAAELASRAALNR